jgi:hypothetical protein
MAENSAIAHLHSAEAELIATAGTVPFFSEGTQELFLV